MMVISQQGTIVLKPVMCAINITMQMKCLLSKIELHTCVYMAPDPCMLTQHTILKPQQTRPLFPGTVPTHWGRKCMGQASTMSQQLIEKYRKTVI